MIDIFFSLAMAQLSREQLLAHLGHIAVLDAAGQLNPAYYHRDHQGQVVYQGEHPAVDWTAVCAALAPLNPMVVHQEHFESYYHVLCSIYPPHQPKTRKRRRPALSTKVLERARLVFSPFQIKVMVDLAKEIVAAAAARDVEEESPAKRARIEPEDAHNNIPRDFDIDFLSMEQ